MSLENERKNEPSPPQPSQQQQQEQQQQQQALLNLPSSINLVHGGDDSGSSSINYWRRFNPFCMSAPSTDIASTLQERESGHYKTDSFSKLLRSNMNRARSGSATAGEIVSALKVPISPKIIILCLIWYMSSALSNTSSKSILNAFPQPVTLTIVQFAFVSGWCLFLSFASRFSATIARSVPGLKGGLRSPNMDIIKTTAPLAFFQVGGHIFSHIATNRIPVSLVATIKGMSPLFTVFAYRLLYNVSYSLATYLSLVPLTIGVMLACSAEFRGNFLGVICAFGAAMIFVSQNIFAKKLFNESNRAEAEGAASKKLDKLNLLCYSSGIAFFLTVPLWVYSEGASLLSSYANEGRITIPIEKMKHPEHALTGSALAGEFFFNGTVHFGQNIIAFVILSIISPVTYSIASLVKRIFVIVLALVWFGNKTTTVQGVGIVLTFIGLYLYDRAGAGDVARGERQARFEQEKSSQPILPLSTLPRESSSLHPGLPNGYVSAASSGEYKRSIDSIRQSVDGWGGPGGGGGPGQMHSLGINRGATSTGAVVHDGWQNSSAISAVAVM